MVFKERKIKQFFDSIDDVEAFIAQREIFVFLDYDGTLTPIVDTPDKAILSSAMQSSIHHLSQIHKVAIVSGRATDDVRKKVNLDQLFYAGSHGFEIISPDGQVTIHPQAKNIQYQVDEIHKQLSQTLCNVEGALVEHVKYTVSVHYRLVDEKDFSKVEDAIHQMLVDFPEFRFTSGKKVFEVRPQIDWHKGKAVRFILDQWNFDQKKHCPIYIGDDTTDEDAFLELSDKGFGIVVAKENKETAASYQIEDTSDVQKIIQYLIDRNESK